MPSIGYGIRFQRHFNLVTVTSELLQVLILEGFGLHRGNGDEQRKLVLLVNVHNARNAHVQIVDER